MKYLLLIALFMATNVNAATWWQADPNVYSDTNQLPIYPEPDITSQALYSVANAGHLLELDQVGDFYQIEIDDITGYVLKSAVIQFVPDQSFMESVVFANVEFKTTSSELYMKMFGLCYVMPLTAMRDLKSISQFVTVQTYIDDNGGMPALTATQEANCEF